MEYFINQGSWTPVDIFKGEDWLKANYFHVAGDGKTLFQELDLFERAHDSKEAHKFMVMACFDGDSVHFFWADDPTSILQAAEFCKTLAKFSSDMPSWLQDFLTCRYVFDGKRHTRYIDNVGDLLDKVAETLPSS